MWRLVPALCACAALLGGCGGGDEAPARTVEVRAGEPGRVSARDYFFDPAGLVAGGAGPVRITLDNRGDLAHNLKVRDDGRELGGIPSIPSGEERSASFNVREGTYELVCTVGDHEEKGMVGTLEVR